MLFLSSIRALSERRLPTTAPVSSLSLESVWPQRYNRTVAMDGGAGQAIGYSTYMLTVSTVILGLTLVILVNGAKQVLFRKRNEPPVVFHWLPFVGSAISYGQEPIRFLDDCQAKVKNDRLALTTVKINTKSFTNYVDINKYGNIFTFVLFGRRVTVYLGINGNNFILNGKQDDLNPQDVYNVITAPVWGSDVVYDVPHAKYMEQKRVCQ